MCGRVNVSSGPLTLLFMDMVGQPYPQIDRYNVAPTEPLPVIRAAKTGDHLEWRTMRWWLTPYWSKAPATRYSMFNAKVESLATSRAFREPFQRRRCLLPIAGFYEWSKDGERRLPYYIAPLEEDGLLIAGIWDRWRNGDDVVESFAIVTTPVHERLSFIHDRQPAIVSRDEGRHWLDRNADPAKLRDALATPRIPVALRVAPVSTYVNNSRNEGERCVEPIGREIAIEADR